MNLFISNFVAHRIFDISLHENCIAICKRRLYIYIYILQETRLSVWPCRIFAEVFIFQFYPFPSGKFFGLISRDRRFRGGNRLYSIRPTELIAVIPLPPLYRIVHRSIRIFVFQFSPPPLPWFILFPPFNHRIGWARFCEKSLKSADPPLPLSPEIRWRDHFFLPRDRKRTFICNENFFSLLIVRDYCWFE